MRRDRRSLGSYPKPSGVLIGHTEGITYVSPKGDGRYIISNGKDQVTLLDTLLIKVGLTVIPDPQVMGPPNDGLGSEIPTGEGQRIRHSWVRLPVSTVTSEGGMTINFLSQ